MQQLPSLTLEPHDDRVIVLQHEAVEKTASGIYIPDTAKEKPTRGVIVAIGEGRFDYETGRLIPTRKKVGDEIIFGKYSGTELVEDGVSYLMIREQDIYATIRPKPETKLISGLGLLVPDKN